MSYHAVLVRLLSYSAMLGIARLMTIGLGAWYCYWRQVDRESPKTIGGFFRFALPSKLWTSASLRIDLSLVVLRRLTGAWGVVPVTGSILLIAPVVYGAMTTLLGVRPQNPPSLLINLGLIIALMLVRDFGEYIVHAASHSSRLLWEFHKAHHSTEFMTPLSAKRSHFVDDLARMVVIGPALGVGVGFLSYLLDLAPVENLLFGVDAYVIGNLICFESLRHSHIPLTFGKAESYLISPAQHQLHHNRYGKPRNFGSFLSLWDRLFGTFAYSAPPGSFEVGINPADQPHYNSVLKLYYRPFWNVGVILKRTWKKRKNKAASAVRTTSSTSSFADT